MMLVLRCTKPPHQTCKRLVAWTGSSLHSDTSVVIIFSFGVKYHACNNVLSLYL